MSEISGLRVLLGVSGGIAAYKSADLVRRLREAGCEVQVVMTEGATRFVTSLTFQAVSGRPVRTDLLDPEAEAAMGHIELARWADVVLVAPASANFLARLAQGRADDLLSTLCLATEADIVVAPAMNRVMWSNAATRANVELLSQRGIQVWGPAEGDQACGETGPGRMLEPTDLVSRLSEFRNDGPLQSVHVLVTAGPTREAIDAVRYISNRSSGKMGFAVAEACRRAGARVTLVSGPVQLPTPAGVDRVNVETAAEIHDACMAAAGDADMFIATAAVADYRPATTRDSKLKKTSEAVSLDLVRNADILADIAGRSRTLFTVGFAAETDDLEHYARQKLEHKRLDMIAANWVGDGRGFDRDENALEVIDRSGRKLSLGPAPKAVLARQLVDHIAEIYATRRPARTSRVSG